jgi:hypothetical protein
MDTQAGLKTRFLNDVEIEINKDYQRSPNVRFTQSRLLLLDKDYTVQILKSGFSF